MRNKLIDLIDLEEVNKLLEGFNQTTGFVTAILDFEGNVLSKSGWREICTQFHRVHAVTSKNCTRSDTVLANESGNGGKYHFYECLNGLVDVAVPIVINGEHIANLFSGQFFFEEPDRTFFRKQAEKYGFNEDAYLSALGQVPVVSKEEVKVAMDFLVRMTQLISETSFQKLEQIQLNEALIKSEERLRNALDHLLEGCQIIGFDWKYIYLNNTAEIQNRRPNAELIGNRYMDIWPGIENTEVFKIIKQVLEKRDSAHFENEFAFPDGSLGWFDLSIQPVPEGAFILSIDITERKIAENKLRTSEEKYRLISDNSDDWIYWVSPDGHLLYVSPACERVTGYSPEEFASHPDLIHEVVFEVDKEKVQKHINQSNRDASPHNLEFRILTKKGEICWISHSCSPIFSNEGEYLGRRVTNRNITIRKHQEEQLDQSEYRFSRLWEAGPFGLMLVNQKFRFEHVNPMFCKMLGYSEEELQQLTFPDISHPDDVVKDLPNIRKLINKEISVYKTDKRYIRKDGQAIWGALTVNANYDKEGQFLYNLAFVEDITERKRSEEKIRDLNERISTATRVSEVGIWDWDIKNNVLAWDDQMYALYGLRKDEFTGAFEAWLNGLHPDDKEFGENETRLALLGEKEYDTEFRVVWPDGTVHVEKAKGEVFRNESGEPVRMLGINYDITEQKRKDEKIREKDQEFRKLSANVPDLIFQFTRKTDGSYCVPIASEGIRNIFGCTPEDVVDDFGPIGRVIYPEDAERVIRDIEYSAENLTYFTCEFRVQIPGREIQWIYSKSTPERLPDGSVTWYGFNTDITQRKLADEEVRKLNETLEQRVSERTLQLQEANQELEAFSYSVSHDLRAPLRHINGFVDLLTENYADLLPEKGNHYLEVILNSSRQMGTLIDDLLRFSRTGRQEMRQTKLDMNVVFQESLKSLEPDTARRKIEWDIAMLPDIMGDQSLLSVVWNNLLSNAVKFTRAKDPAQIQIGFTENKKEYTFFVRDNGVGFDMRFSDKLFGVFQRLHTTKEFEGTGIGLANVRRIILKHGGRTWAESQLEMGSTFYFTLPKH